MYLRQMEESFQFWLAEVRGLGEVSSWRCKLTPDS